MSNLFYGQGINDIYKQICYALIHNPDYILSPRSLKTNELINVTLHINSPVQRILTLKSRHISLYYLAGELCFYLSGSRSLAFISHYSKFWNKISDNGRTVNSCYGYKIFKKKTNKFSQFECARQKLLRDKDTRKAIIMLHTDENNVLYSKDNICTIYLQFFIRDDFLILITHMRSNDIFFGLTYDIPFFTILQEIMLVHLRRKYPYLKLGTYIHNAGSMHFYEKDRNVIFECSRDVVSAPSQLMPGITEKTLEELPLLLKYEEQLRREWKGEIIADAQASKSFNDPFLLTIKNWLEEKK